ncbi:aldo/keto reductase [Agathobaculum sp.]|uniref:aldo/keto reductase n=1 Tax=Agathobaculum sp. TaxID=2048138 RepID=UPI002A7F2F86|nr:aldo/keto reductase [Agathobaculum sp.]MDY3617708.1 aldo/keto reductase [Agathobaculum sp.]
MKKMKLGKSGLEVPRIAIGCMRMSQECADLKKAEAFIRTAMELGVNYFDHADIYDGGESERVFAKAIGMTDTLREQMYLQSKCDILLENGTVVGYNTTREYIRGAVDGILSRLQTDYLDMLLLHRPDPICNYEELGDTLYMLKMSGKVRHFGVSNFTPNQIRLLKRYFDEPVCVDQVQFSPLHTLMISAPINMNNPTDEAVMHEDGLLDFCRLEDITLQAWSPFQAGFDRGTYLGSYIDNPDYPELNKALQKIADQYKITKTSAAIAWIVRHPAKIQPVVGTMKISRLAECLAGAEVELTREDWYAVYRAAGNVLL